MYGKWVPTENELLKPSTTTKATILTAILYASSHISHEVAYLVRKQIIVDGMHIKRSIIVTPVVNRIQMLWMDVRYLACCSDDGIIVSLSKYQ